MLALQTFHPINIAIQLLECYYAFRDFCSIPEQEQVILPFANFM